MKSILKIIFITAFCFLLILGTSLPRLSGQTPCNQGPPTPETTASTNLDHDADNWGVYCEGSPNWSKQNVTAPSFDGEALECAITGGSPYSNVHCYRNLTSEPTASVFVLDFYFWFPVTTHNQNDSIIQAIEFTMNKWYQGKRYEIALQWQNIIDGTGSTPQWRYWDPYGEEQWVAFDPPIPAILTGGLNAGNEHHLILEGEIIGGHVHYQRFEIDGQSYSLDILIPPLCTAPGDTDRLAVAFQLDGNSAESPYNVVVDKLNFIRAPQTMNPPAGRPRLIAPADSITTNSGQPTFIWQQVSGASTYELELGSVDDRDVLSSGSITGTRYTPNTPLKPGIYYWRVRTATSSWSNPRCIQINIRQNYYGALPVALTWNPISWATGYELEVDDNADFGSPEYEIDTLSNTDTTVSISALSNGSYFWRIRAKNENGVWQGWSQVEQFMLEVP